MSSGVGSLSDPARSREGSSPVYRAKARDLEYALIRELLAEAAQSNKSSLRNKHRVLLASCYPSAQCCEIWAKDGAGKEAQASLR